MTENLAAYFTDFGISATVGGVSVRAVFDAAFADALGMANTQPSLTVATADLPAVAQGQTAVVNGSNYTVQAIEPDGTGVSSLILRRV